MGKLRAFLENLAEFRGDEADDAIRIIKWQRAEREKWESRALQAEIFLNSATQTGRNGGLNLKGSASVYVAIRRMQDYVKDNPDKDIEAAFALQDWIAANPD